MNAPCSDVLPEIRSDSRCVVNDRVLLSDVVRLRSFSPSSSAFHQGRSALAFCRSTASLMRPRIIVFRDQGTQVGLQLVDRTVHPFAECDTADGGFSWCQIHRRTPAVNSRMNDALSEYLGTNYLNGVIPLFRWLPVVVGFGAIIHVPPGPGGAFGTGVNHQIVVAAALFPCTTPQ
jgi:hypothetical protein